jgi:hypothetical protein
VPWTRSARDDEATSTKYSFTDVLTVLALPADLVPALERSD